MLTYVCYYIQSEDVGDGADTQMIGFGVNVAKLKEHCDTNNGDGVISWEISTIAEQFGGGYRYFGYVNEEDDDNESCLGQYIIEPIKEIV